MTPNILQCSFFFALDKDKDACIINVLVQDLSPACDSHDYQVEAVATYCVFKFKYYYQKLDYIKLRVKLCKIIELYGPSEPRF